MTTKMSEVSCRWKTPLKLSIETSEEFINGAFLSINLNDFIFLYILLCPRGDSDTVHDTRDFRGVKWNVQKNTSLGDIGPAKALTHHSTSTGLFRELKLCPDWLSELAGDQGWPMCGGLVLSSDLNTGMKTSSAGEPKECTALTVLLLNMCFWMH